LEGLRGCRGLDGRHNTAVRRQLGGKSSILQGLLLMKQSWGHGNLQLEGKLGSFGWYQHVIHRHDQDRNLTLAADWGGIDGTMSGRFF
jgi:hypothetical protein